MHDTSCYRLVKLGPEGALTGAGGAIDIALWDFEGESCPGQPIHKLLGGTWRTALPFGPSIGGNGDRTLDEVLRVVEARLKDKPAAVKIPLDNEGTIARIADIPERHCQGQGGAPSWSATCSTCAFDANNAATRPAARSGSGRGLSKELGFFGGSKGRCNITTSRRWVRWRSNLDITPSRPASRPIRLPALADLIIGRGAEWCRRISSRWAASPGWQHCYRVGARARGVVGATPRPSRRSGTQAWACTSQPATLHATKPCPSEMTLQSAPARCSRIRRCRWMGCFTFPTNPGLVCGSTRLNWPNAGCRWLNRLRWPDGGGRQAAWSRHRGGRP